MDFIRMVKVSQDRMSVLRPLHTVRFSPDFHPLD